MSTDLGYVSHDYMWVDGVYYRRRRCGMPNWEMWTGAWQPADPPQG